MLANFAEVARFFDRGVAAADDDDRLVPEARQGAVAHGTRGDALVLELVFARQAEVIARAPVATINDRVSTDSPSCVVIVNGRFSTEQSAEARAGAVAVPQATVRS